MDFEGKHFPDEEDVNKPEPSKASKIIKRTFKWLFFGIVVFVWILTLASIILRSDNKLVDTPVLSAQARAEYTLNKDEFSLWRVFTQKYMDYSGTVQLKKNVYCATANELEIGVRVSAKLTDGNVNEKLFYVLKDSKGNQYPVVNRTGNTKDIQLGGIVQFQYIFERISFGDIYLSLDDNIINREESINISEIAQSLENDLSSPFDVSGPEDNFDTLLSAGTSYTLEIYRYVQYKGNGESGFETDENGNKVERKLIFSTVVYDNNTNIKEIEFEMPSSKYTG